MRIPSGRFRLALLLPIAAALAAQQANSQYGAISGRVLDANGRPMQQVSVSAIGPGGASMETASAPDGYYRLYYLPAGRYRMRAEPRAINLPPEIRTDGSTEVHYATAYYPASLTLESATPVDLQPGAERAETDIRLVPIPIVAVRGVVTGIPGGLAYVGLSIAKAQPRTAPNVSHGMRMGYSHKVNPDGSFVIWGLDPGTYTLTAESNGAGWNSPAVQVEVKDKDVDGVALSMVGQIDISGQVVPGDDGARLPPIPPNASPAQTPQISLVGPDGGPGGGHSMIAADGSFHFAKVPPGKYTAVLTWGPYVQSMRLGAANIDGPALDLTHGFTGGALTVTASSATGQVGGVVANPAAPGARLLVRLVSDESPALDRGTLARPDGSFTIANIRPGRYKLFVMDPGASPALVIRTVLSDYADVTESIEIHPGDTLTRDLRRHAK